MKRVIKTKKAPEAIGPYSQGILINKILFISGQISIIPETGELIKDDIRRETEQVMNNIKAIVEEAGGNMSDIVKTTIYLTNINNFNEVNEVYAAFFKESPPARATVEVSFLPKGVGVEIDATAVINGD
ncbi:MAG TPA: RidA family protein [candidate division WOR-3 bacterium]|uniref:RidA family protein n=1 Tax=candidate division WOR-3 bacterium TaxID=2052148 RepID=A0A7C5DAQ2_UNCW3|nr:RidA family protein [candidate division WOR-3 bacterium]